MVSLKFCSRCKTDRFFNENNDCTACEMELNEIVQDTHTADFAKSA